MNGRGGVEVAGMAIGVLRELEALRERKRQRRRGWWVSAFRRQPLSGLPWLGVTAFGFGIFHRPSAAAASIASLEMSA